MGDWEELDGGFRRRTYPDYPTYLEKQAEKLGRRHGFAEQQSAGVHSRMWKRITTLADYLPPNGNVLCLGARLGGEVQAFIDKGYFAVGIDINPGEDNPYVLYGDFHTIVFPDDVIDIVYTNSLDHVLDMPKLLAEVRRILKPVGCFLTENKGGVAETEMRSARSDGYDCMEWLTLEGLVAFIQQRGFEVIHRYRFRGFTPHGAIFQVA